MSTSPERRPAKVGLDDFLAKHSIEELLERVSEKPPWASIASPFEAAEGSIDLMITPERTVRPVAKRQMIVAGLIPEKVSGLIVAPGGTGKGFALMHLAVHVATGRPIGPFEVPGPRGVLYVSREDDQEELHRRFADTISAHWPGKLRRAHVALLKANLRFVDLCGLAGAAFGEELTDAVVEAAGRMESCGLVILDPLTRFLPPEWRHTLNAQEGAGWVHVQMDEIVARTGATVLMAHHVAKGRGVDADAATGSKLLVDLSRFVLQLRQLDAADARRYGLDAARAEFIECVVTKSNYTPPVRTPLVFVRGEGGAFEALERVRRPAEVEGELALRAIASAVDENGGDGISTTARNRAVAAALDCKQRKAEDLGARLARAGFIGGRGTSRGKTWTVTAAGKLRLDDEEAGG